MSHPHPELSAPADLPTGGLRVIPLGGLGEVGRNMTVFEYDGRLLIVDCGVLFPEENHPGVDLILPDFDAIRDRLDDVEALVLTHGHEDHIGAVPYLLRERGDIPLVGSAADPGAARLQAARAPAQGHRPRTIVAGGRPDQLRPLRPRVRRGQPLDPRRARGRDPHRRRAGAAHRRLQDGPAAARRPDHRPARLRPARRGGRRPVPDRLDQRRGPRLHHLREGHRARCSTGSSTSSEQRIIVACFASHVHRVQQVIDAAAEHGRKVAYVGRSMVRNMAHRPRPRLPRRTARPAGRRQGRSPTCRPSRRC